MSYQSSYSSVSLRFTEEVAVRAVFFVAFNSSKERSKGGLAESLDVTEAASLPRIILFRLANRDRDEPSVRIYAPYDLLRVETVFENLRREDKIEPPEIR